MMHNVLPPLSYAAVLEAIEEIPTACRAVRRIRRLTLKDAAEEIGIGPNTLAKIEDGGEYRTETLRMVIRWLDTQPETAMNKVTGLE